VENCADFEKNSATTYNNGCDINSRMRYTQHETQKSKQGPIGNIGHHRSTHKHDGDGTEKYWLSANS